LGRAVVTTAAAGTEAATESVAVGVAFAGAAAGLADNLADGVAVAGASLVIVSSGGGCDTPVYGLGFCAV
jgi:hypothetical protein